MTEYAELHCHSYFSLLDGASSPEALVTRAHEIGVRALALTDHDSLAGAIRFWTAAKRVGLPAIIGAEVTMADGCHLTLLAETQKGYANLCKLLTAARMEKSAGAGKVPPALAWSILANHTTGLIVLSGCRQGPIARPLLQRQPEQALAAAHHLLDLFGCQQLYLEVQQHGLPDDDWLNQQILTFAYQLDLPPVATNNVHYAQRHGSRLRDALLAIGQNQPLTANRLPYNGTYHLTVPPFDLHSAAMRNTLAIAERCQASLDFSHHRLPTFPTPDGLSEFAYLYQLCHANLSQRYPRLTPRVLKQLAHELDIIERAGLAGYFLIVWDIIQFARANGIRCQGRGSAANAIVAYLLAITQIDPLQHNLLFERFLSEDKFTMPDIDIDFAADRREEVIQYVYQRYGAAHTAMVCTVVTYQARSALRDLGKALDFPLPVVEGLLKAIDTHSCTAAADHLLQQAEAANHPLRLLAELLRQIDGCPRHLSIHSGGMLITGLPLDEVVPLEPATMPGRVVCQWNKESVEDAGLIKIDLLGLRTLGLITEVVTQTGVDIDAIPLDDPNVYHRLQTGDTIGAFQVESRAQQQMLPRLKPFCFEDIAIEVAIVRPGPIQGGAVHPYLRRRAGLEPVQYLHPCLEPVLAETLGVLLFQEQAIRVAVVAAGFTPGEADLLRRALSRGAPEPAIAERFRQGARRQGLDDATAAAIYQQLVGFAGYGFCKSHAASFALIAYQTLWLKHYHPAAFYSGLLNHQPMGFYQPEVIIGDARRHGIELLPPDVNRSAWRYTVEGQQLRMGLATISGLGEAGWQRIAVARPFTGLADFCHRTHLAQAVVTNLIRAGALDAFDERRRLLWELGALAYHPDELPITMPAIHIELLTLDPLEQTAWEYELLGLSPTGQILRHYRPALQAAGVMTALAVKQAMPGQRVHVAGMVVVRQRPATAKGILFLSLEDETGLLDLVVKPAVYQRLSETLRHEQLLLVSGLVQRAEGVVSLLVGAVQKLG